jgi:hypothetical protein
MLVHACSKVVCKYPSCWHSLTHSRMKFEARNLPNPCDRKTGGVQGPRVLELIPAS